MTIEHKKHYVLDEWFEDAGKLRLRGEAHEIRFADDAILCFHYREDAERIKNVLSKRFAKYGLTLLPEKTRLLEFGRYAEAREEAGQEETRHLRLSRFGAHLCTQPEREVHSACADDAQAAPQEPLLQSLDGAGSTDMQRWTQRKTLNAKLRGHYQYYARPTNSQSLLKSIAAS